MVIELQEVQIESQGPEPHLEPTELVQTKFKGPEPQIEGPELEVEVQNGDSEIHPKPKEPVLARYVRRHHAPNQIIGDK